MTLLFTDGFDHYNNTHGYGFIDDQDSMKYPITPYFASVTLDRSYSRDYNKNLVDWNQEGKSKAMRGMKCTYSPFDGPGSFRTPGFTPSDTVVAGIAFYIGEREWGGELTGEFEPIFAFPRAVEVRLNEDYTFSVYNRDTDALLGTTEAAVLPTTSSPIWYFMELKVFVSETVGTVEFRINGVPWLNLTGVNTGWDGLPDEVGGFRFACPSEEQYVVFDDLYVLNDQGTENNDFLGDVKITSLLMNGQGVYEQLIPVDNQPFERNNYYLVRDTYSVDITNYNTPLDTHGLKDSYLPGDITPNLTSYVTLPIFSITINSVMQNDSFVVNDTYPLIRTEGVDYLQPFFTIDDSDWKVYQSILELNPNTALAWTAEDIDNIEIGVQSK
jgi:hypothetical protein